jgi:hypothetical protein
MLASGLPVGLVEQACRGVAASKPERQCRAERHRTQQRDVRDLDDRGRDPQLIEDHESCDAHDQDRRSHPGDLARGAVTERARDETARRRRQHTGDDEDQDRHDDVRQVRRDGLEEVVERPDAELRDRDRQSPQEDEPEGDRADDLAHPCVGQHAIDIRSSRSAGERPVDADALERLDEHGLDGAGDQPADEQDDEEADEPRQEADELVESLL